jgi:branched-chain amino acid transport system permease protein
MATAKTLFSHVCRWEAMTLLVLVLLPRLVLLVLPRQLAEPIGSRVTDLFVFGILALGLNVVVGYTGLLHLGIGAFFGIGAYITGILTVGSYPFQVGLTAALVASALGTALCGLVLGAPILRLRGDYLALVTLGFGEVVKVTLRNLEAITAGTQSLGPLVPPTVPAWLAPGLTSVLRVVAGPSVAQQGEQLADFTTDYRLYYFLALAMLAGTVLLLRNLEDSRLGRAWVALREDELAASCMAINTTRIKLAAFALGSALAGVAGCLYATKLTNTANPETYGFSLSITVLCCLILGGLGSIRGALLGVLLLQGYEFILAPLLDQWAQGARAGMLDWLTLHFPNTFPEEGSALAKVQTLLTFSNWKLMTFGLVLILMVRFRPAGLLPSRRVKQEFAVKEVQPNMPK